MRSILVTTKECGKASVRKEVEIESHNPFQIGKLPVNASLDPRRTGPITLELTPTTGTSFDPDIIARICSPFINRRIIFRNPPSRRFESLEPNLMPQSPRKITLLPGEKLRLDRGKSRTTIAI